jgi:acyl-CoA dehydrogenase
MNILTWLISKINGIDPSELRTLAEWKTRFDAATDGWDDPADRAVIGGFIADRTAYAFAAGYESALRRLVPALPARAIVSFCVTEEKGGHPSSVKSTLRRTDDGAARPWVLNGGKKFITMACEAELLLVAASAGASPDGRNMIRMALVRRQEPGIAIQVMSGLPFVPEISHGTMTFTDVRLGDGDILPGDGYRDYIRPFRTVEDLHVFAAVAGFLFRVACLSEWPRAVIEQTASLIACTRALAAEDPSSPATHIALGGLHAQFSALLESTAPLWGRADEKTRICWERDRALLRVAESARVKRLDTAWSSFAKGPA